MPHETRKEWFKRMNFLIILLYILGCLSLKKNKYSSLGTKRFGIYLRVIHPLSWIVIVFSILRFGFNSETWSLLKEESVWFY